MIRAEKMVLLLMIGRIPNLKFTILKIGKFHLHAFNEKRYDENFETVMGSYMTSACQMILADLIGSRSSWTRR